MQKARVWLVVLVVLGLALFLTGCELLDDTVVVTWATTAEDYNPGIGDEITLTLPPGGDPVSYSNAWGTSVYTADSSIGTAAVYEDRIEFLTGGTVTIRILAGQVAYFGGIAEGVTTLDWDDYDLSFEFIP